MYEAKLEFLVGGGANKKTFHGGSMNILWNCTFHLFAKLYTSLVLAWDPVELKQSHTYPFMKNP